MAISRPLSVLALAMLTLPALSCPTPSWAEPRAAASDLHVQYGTKGDDSATDVAVDGARIFVGGQVRMHVGMSSGNGIDVRRYDRDGSLVWSDAFGLADLRTIRAVPGGVLVIGESLVDLVHPEDPNSEAHGVFVRMYSNDGEVLWTHQDYGDFPWGEVALVDGGHLYLVQTLRGALPGQTGAGHWDLGVQKFDLATGAVAWGRTFGSAKNEYAYSLVMGPGGDLYVGGHTNGAWRGAGGQVGADDALLLRLDSVTGDMLWARQFGSARPDDLGEVLVSGGRLVVSGLTEGRVAAQPSAGGADAFVAAFSPDGRRLWTDQFGSAGSDWAGQLAPTASGFVVSAGIDGDTFVRGYTNAGTQRWSRKLGPKLDRITDLTVANGSVYAVGSTRRALFGPRLGAYDAFLTSFRLP
jgi:hypothetical protein